jgi:hypothetical protein
MTWVQFLARIETFLPATMSGPALLSTQPPVQWVVGALFLEVEWPNLKAYHQPLSSADVKNTWSYTSIQSYIFMVWCLLEAQG